MTGPDPKDDLHRYLQSAREALLWKLDGLSEYDVRRPLVPTGTNLLGLVKHRYRHAWAHSDATIRALAMDAIGHVPWWPPHQNEVTLGHVLVRVATDTSRHAGQADIIRELIDGTVGLTSQSANMPSGDEAWWQSHRDRVEHAARQAAQITNQL